MSLCINPNCPKPSNPNNNLYCQSCGSELLLKGRYRVTCLLSSKGGFGNTYEAVENSEAKVLKVLTNDHPHAIRLFQQEAEVLNRLNHPGIPKGEGWFAYFPRNSQTPLHCLVMEKIEGVDLEEYLKLKNFKPIDQKLAIEWLFQLANILKEVHHQNFFHRDIKPSNIILKPNGQLVIIDFGAARQVTSTILAGNQNTQIYTSGYAPPEQEKGYAVQQSDFFALGRTFVFLLTGKEPRNKDIYDYYNNELNWRKHTVKIAPQLADFLDELMAEKATQRPANAEVISKRLKEIVQELSSPKKPSLKTKISQPETSLNTQTVGQAKTPSQASTGSLGNIQYAGFWLRLRAFFIDRAIIVTMAVILGGALGWYLNDKGIVTVNADFTIEWLLIYSSLWTVLGTTIIGLIFAIIKLVALANNPSQFLQDEREIFILAALILGIAFQWFYYVILESSWFKTTPGKMMVGIVVTDADGKKISLIRANQRYWGKYISMLPLYIGFVMSGFTKKKQALHDKMSKTLVVKNKRKI
ncbi:MAG: protein kinase [Hydrococcus sp. Prado102]|jgi:serine/threonine protein kinase|nr:protein kinase [Hydrococcus sp. Prado102]